MWRITRLKHPDGVITHHECEYKYRESKKLQEGLDIDKSPPQQSTPEKSAPEKGGRDGIYEGKTSGKSIRYVAWAAGSLITLAILCINDGSFSRHGFFAGDIKDAMVFDLLTDIICEFGAYLSTARSVAYFLWFACLAGGVYLSWKYRFKTAKIVGAVLKNIHEKA